MNLQHILMQLPFERLQGLAEEFGLSSISPSKTTLIHAVYGRYRDEAFMRVLFDELHSEAKGLLAFCLFFAPREEGRFTIPGPVHSLWCVHKRLQDHLQEILYRGFLFEGSGGTGPVYLLPDEIAALLIRIMNHALKPSPVIQEVALIEGEARHSGLEGVYHLLGVLRRHPAKLTQKGDMHRKTYERWASRFPYIPPREAFLDYLFAFCQTNQLILHKHDRIRVALTVRDWFAQGLGPTQAVLWKGLFDDRINTDPEFFSLVLYLLLLHRSVSTPDRTVVIDRDSLYSCLAGRPLFQHESQPIPRSKFDDCLELLVASGLLNCVGAGDGRMLRLTADSVRFFEGTLDAVPPEEHRTMEPCMLQPSFQLLVPPNYSYSVLWDLDECAELIRRDVLTEFQITKERILQALRAGWTPARLQRFFLELTLGKMPDNVRYSLEEWCGKYGQIQMRRVVLLECKTKELADEIPHLPAVQSMDLERIADRYYVVEEAVYRTLYQELLDRGYEPSIVRRDDGKEPEFP
ncbi:MAG: helicase-associated domain-containing protein [bacterium]|jgi:hypothetical protein|nr:helicase-associated domain-containing protein [bacterium]